MQRSALEQETEPIVMSLRYCSSRTNLCASIPYFLLNEMHDLCLSKSLPKNENSYSPASRGVLNQYTFFFRYLEECL